MIILYKKHTQTHTNGQNPIRNVLISNFNVYVVCTIYQSYCVELVYDQGTMAFEKKKKRKRNTPKTNHKIKEKQETPDQNEQQTFISYCMIFFLKKNYAKFMIIERKVRGKKTNHQMLVRIVIIVKVAQKSNNALACNIVNIIEIFKF